MKFMKLGSKPDSFQSDEDNIRYVSTDLGPDLVVNVGEVKFYLHKFPLLSKSARLQKLAEFLKEKKDEIQIHDIPGGPAAFEICAKFCYGMTVTLNAYNVVAARCAAEYLEMYETVEKSNLVYKIEVFLNSSVFASWKDSIIVLQTTNSLLPWSEELKVVSHSLEAITSKVSADTLKVDWSYTYNRKKLPLEIDRKKYVPSDWWVEDLCELELNLYKRVITTLLTKGKTSEELIGESLKAYAAKRLPVFNKGVMRSGDVCKARVFVETTIELLPAKVKSVSCGFLFKLLQASILLECSETGRDDLKKRIVEQLDEARLGDLLIQAQPEDALIFNTRIIQEIIEDFLCANNDCTLDSEFVEISGSGGLVPSDNSSNKSNNSSKFSKVAKLVEGYLVEVARDPNLPHFKFLDLTEMALRFSRNSDDLIYRAIDMYLKEHPKISKSERKRICRLMDCKKLSSDACKHAIQNERLPLRIVVQVLFFEQIRATSSPSGTPGEESRSRESSRTTTTNTEEWEALHTSDELKALAALRLRSEAERSRANPVSKTSRIFGKILSSKEKSGENSGSDTSESRSSRGHSPSMSRRHSLS